MALIVDAGALYAQADERDPGHAAAARILRAERGSLITSGFAVAEADHLILGRLGPRVELAFLDDLADGTYQVECLGRDELATARSVVARYADLRLRLSDAALVVLAARFRTRRILTFNERAFRVVAPLQGGSFEVLPADAAR